MSIESGQGKRKERFEVREEPINGFLHATQITSKRPSTFSYTLDAANYNPEIKIPPSGEFMLKPEDILENVHFYVYANFGPEKLRSFSFAYSHYSDIEREFVGKKFEIGSESVMKSFVSQPEFKKLYDEGSVFYDLDGQDYFFGINLQTKNIVFAVNGTIFAEIPSDPSKEGPHVEIYAPFSKM